MGLILCTECADRTNEPTFYDSGDLMTQEEQHAIEAAISRSSLRISLATNAKLREECRHDFSEKRESFANMIERRCGSVSDNSAFEDSINLELLSKRSLMLDGARRKSQLLSTEASKFLTA